MLKMANPTKTLIIGLCLVFFSNSGLLAGQDPVESQDVFDIRLITFSPVDDVFAWFGHTAVEVKNNLNGNSYIYSFGGFSFDPGEMLKFAFGHFVFWGYAHESKSYLQSYEEEKRHIVFQTLNLTFDQKQKIGMKLHKYVQPENRNFVYEHFYKNCSTRPRDIFDEALDGKLKARMSAIDHLTFRQYIHRMTSHLPALDFVLLFLLNDTHDKPITVWESMFLPDRLMIGFGKAKNPATDEQLVEKEEETNIGGKSSFFQLEAVAPNTVLREGLTGLFFFLVLSMTGFLYVKQEKLYDRLYPGLVSIFALIFGALGSGLFFMMCFTDHHDSIWNENLFLLNPFTLLLLPLGVIGIPGKGKKLFCQVSVLCGIIAMTGIVLKIVPVFDQDNSQQLRILLPALLVIGITGFLGLKKKSENM